MVLRLGRQHRPQLAKTLARSSWTSRREFVVALMRGGENHLCKKHRAACARRSPPPNAIQIARPTDFGMHLRSARLPGQRRRVGKHRRWPLVRYNAGRPVCTEVAMTNGEKTCTQCGTTQSVENFRRRCRGTENRHSECNCCHNEHMRRSRQAKRLARIDGFVRQVRGRSIEHIEHLVGATVRRVGGVERFAEMWASTLRAALASNSHGTITRSFRVLTDLIIEVDRVRHQRIATMPDDDLEAEIDDLIAARVARLAAATGMCPACGGGVRGATSPRI